MCTIPVGDTDAIDESRADHTIVRPNSWTCDASVTSACSWTESRPLSAAPSGEIRTAATGARVAAGSVLPPHAVAMTVMAASVQRRGMRKIPRCIARIAMVDRRQHTIGSRECNDRGATVFTDGPGSRRWLQEYDPPAWLKGRICKAKNSGGYHPSTISVPQIPPIREPRVEKAVPRFRVITLRPPERAIRNPCSICSQPRFSCNYIGLGLEIRSYRSHQPVCSPADTRRSTSRHVTRPPVESDRCYCVLPGRW